MVKKLLGKLLSKRRPIEMLTVILLTEVQKKKDG
jgi:hypothetical protein